MEFAIIIKRGYHFVNLILEHKVHAMGKQCINKEDAIKYGDELLSDLKALANAKQSECNLISHPDGCISYMVTDCCKVGPITNERFCPNCGKKIINN